jgi:hypothetical protein
MRSDSRPSWNPLPRPPAQAVLNFLRTRQLAYPADGTDFK